MLDTCSESENLLLSKDGGTKSLTSLVTIEKYWDCDGSVRSMSRTPLKELLSQILCRI
jgi:hypothetical protein